MRPTLVVLLVLLMVIPSIPPAFAQESGVQAYEGSISTDEPIALLLIPNLEEGQTIYLYAESADFDTWITICGLDCEEPLGENDDLSEDTTNSALEFEVPASGDYFIQISDCCNEKAEGAFTFLVSLDDPKVLTGEAKPTGAEILFLGEAADTEYADACIPDLDKDGFYDMVALFDTLGIPEATLQDMLDVNGWESIENLQQLSNDNELNWFFLIPYLQDVAKVTLHMCDSSTAYDPEGENAPYKNACLPDSGTNDVVALFEGMNLPDDLAQGFLDRNGWETLENLQELSDNGEIYWFYTIPYLQDVTSTTIHVCDGSTPYQP